MIKFACPGCAEVYSVEDAKAGKSGKCPKCQADFVIPGAESTATPSLPAPSAPPVEIRPCPGCHAKLSVTAEDVGKDVECPYCRTTFRAMASRDVARQSGRSGDTVEDDRPRKRSERRERYDDDFGDDRPRRREPESQNLGTVALVTGIVSLPIGCCCGVISIPLSLTAIVTGALSLKTAGRGMGLAGLIAGIVSLIFTVGMLAAGLGGQFMNMR